MKGTKQGHKACTQPGSLASMLFSQAISDDNWATWLVTLVMLTER